MMRFLLVLAVLMMASSAEARESSRSQCSDDAGADRCAQEVQAKTRAKYGLETAEKLAMQGTYVRRAMIVDGYGQDVLAISFLREKGADPRVEIRLPQGATANRPHSLSATLSAAQWTEVLRRGTYFDRDFVPLADKNMLSLCLHGSVAIVETVDPVRLSDNTLPATTKPALVRRKVQSACTDGLALEYAFELVDMAYAALPFCQTLQPTEHRSKAALLNSCFHLSGDRVAAAEGASLFHQLNAALNNKAAGPAAMRVAVEQLIVTPDPNDDPRPGTNRITRAQKSALVDIIADGALYFISASGVDADHVVIEADQIQPAGHGSAASVMRRRLKLLASRETGSFRIYGVEAGRLTRPHPLHPPRARKKLT